MWPISALATATCSPPDRLCILSLELQPPRGYTGLKRAAAVAVAAERNFLPALFSASGAAGEPTPRGPPPPGSGRSSAASRSYSLARAGGRDLEERAPEAIRGLGRGTVETLGRVGDLELVKRKPPAGRPLVCSWPKSSLRLEPRLRLRFRPGLRGRGPPGRPVIELAPRGAGCESMSAREDRDPNPGLEPARWLRNSPAIKHNS